MITAKHLSINDIKTIKIYFMPHRDDKTCEGINKTTD